MVSGVIFAIIISYRCDAASYIPLAPAFYLMKSCRGTRLAALDARVLRVAWPGNAARELMMAMRVIKYGACVTALPRKPPVKYI